MAQPGNENPAVDPAEGGSQEVGERMGSLETQLSQLTTLVSSLVENQRELVSSLIKQQGEKVESSGFVATAPGGGGPETSLHFLLMLLVERGRYGWRCPRLRRVQHAGWE